MTAVRPALPVKADKVAKADLRKAETQDFRVSLGAAIRRARLRSEWSLKELAGELDRDERQVARWESGDERAHWDALFAIEGFRQRLIIALAELGGASVEIETIVRVRRSA
jgi:ribosome-binding protein aMBF1 (putative translation factor)